MASRAASLLLTVPVLISMAGCGSGKGSPQRSEDKLQERLFEMGQSRDVDRLRKIVEDDTEDNRVRKAAEKRLDVIIGESKQNQWGAVFYAKTQRLLDLMTESSVPEPSHLSKFFGAAQQRGLFDIIGDGRLVAGHHFYYPKEWRNMARKTSEQSQDRWYYTY